jgi:hypothetical protein
MVIVTSFYLRFYMEVGVGTFLPTPTLPKIPSDSDPKAQVQSTTATVTDVMYTNCFRTAIFRTQCIRATHDSHNIPPSFL